MSEPRITAERLRDEASTYQYPGAPIPTILRVAADTIDALTAERDDWRTDRGVAMKSILSKRTDDGLFMVVIFAADLPEGAVVCGNPLAKLSALLTETASTILEGLPTAVCGEVAQWESQ